MAPDSIPPPLPQLPSLPYATAESNGWLRVASPIFLFVGIAAWIRVVALGTQIVQIYLMTSASSNVSYSDGFERLLSGNSVVVFRFAVFALEMLMWMLAGVFSLLCAIRRDRRSALVATSLAAIVLTLAIGCIQAIPLVTLRRGNSWNEYQMHYLIQSAAYLISILILPLLLVFILRRTRNDPLLAAYFRRP